MPKSVKICILFDFVDKPFGGGNQFLKALRKYFNSVGAYEESPQNADAILFNSHHNIPNAARARLKNPRKRFVHRIDGPMGLYTNPGDQRDKIVYEANRLLADATIFQSEWSRENNYALGLGKKDLEFVIMNAPDPDIFNRTGKIAFSKDRKIRLVSTSWSSNFKRGFGIYQWLDNNLNFEKYEMTFAGNSPIKFKNVKYLEPLKSTELAKILKNSDIFISASQNDPCSNSLIEAMHCGLPALVLNSGGHPEIVRGGGEVFETKEQIPGLIEKVVNDFELYQSRIAVATIEQVGQKYYNAVMKVYQDTKEHEFGIFKYYKLLATINLRRAIGRVSGFFNG